MIKFRYLLLLLCFFILLPACTNTKKPINQANIPVESLNIKNRIALANSLYKNHDYASALVQWKVLRTINPKNPEYKNRIRVLQALIKRRANFHIASGQDAMERKDFSAAELSLLKALAREPRHSTALSLLKKIEANRVETKQQAKTRRLKKKQLAKLSKAQQVHENHPDHSQEQLYLEMGLNLYRKGDWSGSIREIKKYLSINEHDQKAKNTVARSHFKLSQIFESRGHLEPAIQHLEDGLKNSKQITEQQQEKLITLKEAISENFYVNGVKSYRNNIDQAIVYWEKAINYNPNHFKAKNRLSKATQIQKNLKKIKK